MQALRNFFRTESYLKHGHFTSCILYNIAFNIHHLDKCSIKITVGKVYELKQQPSYKQMNILVTQGLFVHVA